MKALPPFPVIIDIHGGGWRFGNKSSFKMEPALNLLKRGYAVVSPNYTLSSHGQYPTPVFEMKAAVRYTKAVADKYGLDRNRIALMGESAGAHLAALCAASSSCGALEDMGYGHSEYSSKVQAVIGVYCPSNLTQYAADRAVLGIDPGGEDQNAPDSPLGAFLGGRRLSEIPQVLVEASPIHYVNEKCPPFMFLHGSKDEEVPILQSLNLASSLIRCIGHDKVEHHIIEGAEHNIFDFETEEIYDAEARFLARHL